MTKETTRRHLRVQVVLQIRFLCIEDMEQMIKASTLNLSEGGMFICTDQLREKGRRVEIEFPLPGGSIRISGVIIHVRYIDGQPFGIGIEFDEFDEPTRQAMEGLIIKLQKEDDRKARE